MVLKEFGTTLLKKFCGKSNSSLKKLCVKSNSSLVSQIRHAVNDDRIQLEVSHEYNEVYLYASPDNIRHVAEIIYSTFEHEGMWLQNECLEKCLFPDRHETSPVALFGSGAEIKHLELEKRCLTVDILIHGPCGRGVVEEKELLSFLEKHTSGDICAVHKLNNNGYGQESKKWGRVTFLTPEAAEKATKLTTVEFKGCKLKIKICPSAERDNIISSFPGVKAKVSWPRRQTRGVAFVKCYPYDVLGMVEDLSNMKIGGKSIDCRRSRRRSRNSVVLSGLDVDLFEDELYVALKKATNRDILNLFLPWSQTVVVENPPLAGNKGFRVCIFPCEAMDYLMKADISFDGSLHLEAARALEQIHGKALPGCQAWQRIKCQLQFTSNVSCPASAYRVIKDQLHSLLKTLKLRRGAEFFFDRNENGRYRVKISAESTKIMAESRRALEQLMNGRTIIDDQLTPPVIQGIFSREGFSLQKSIERETGTYILFDRHSHSFRVFGPVNSLDLAQHKLVQSLVALHANRRLDFHLWGREFPKKIVKKLVEKFGPRLLGLKERFPGLDFTLDARHHIISIRGSTEESARELMREIVRSTDLTPIPTPLCPICLCDVEDGYRLENCNHQFCRACLVQQCESSIKSSGSRFPICCASKRCGALILTVDLKSLLSPDKLDEPFHASLGSFVERSRGKYRFCPSPDCSSVYQVAEDDGGDAARPFSCMGCSVDTCTRCHLEYHPFVSCEAYKDTKRDPDASLKEWIEGKEEVKHCPVCMLTIEKIDGCNHVRCRCGTHICWVCLEDFTTTVECYAHLHDIHHSIV